MPPQDRFTPILRRPGMTGWRRTTLSQMATNYSCFRWAVGTKWRDPYPSNWWDHTLACRNQSVGLAITGPLFTERVEPEAGRGINRLINRPSFSSAVLDDPPLPSAWYQTPKFSSTLLSSTLNSTGSRLTDYSYSTGSGRRTTLKQRGLD